MHKFKTKREVKVSAEDSKVVAEDEKPMNSETKEKNGLVRKTSFDEKSMARLNRDEEAKDENILPPISQRN